MKRRGPAPTNPPPAGTLPRTHTFAHFCTRTHTFAHFCTLSHSHTQYHTFALALALSQFCTRTRTLSHSHSHTFAFAHFHKGSGLSINSLTIAILPTFTPHMSFLSFTIHWFIQSGVMAVRYGSHPRGIRYRGANGNFFLLPHVTFSCAEHCMWVDKHALPQCDKL
jgi:hypothetical protein